MNDKKFCFIMCVNDDLFEAEALKYIGKINIPEGYEIEQLSVRDAASMASGYNEAMRSSDAKYKIYMHQDVFIFNRDILYRLLEIFSDETVGIVGLVGAEKMPDSCVMWDDSRCGRLAICAVSWAGDCGNEQEIIEGRVREVEAVDGLFIATQYDVPWREDIFTGWDFYDASQPFEMRKNGYRAVVPDMNEPWLIHDAGLANLDKYYVYRDIFRKEYFDKTDKLNEEENYAEDRALAKEGIAKIDEILASGSRDRFRDIAPMFTREFCQGPVSKNALLLTLFGIMSALEAFGFDDREKLFEDCYSLEDISVCWDRFKFALWEVEFELDEEAENRLYSFIKTYEISNELIKKLIETTAVDCEKMYMILACIFMDHGDVDRGKWILAEGKINVTANA